MKDERGKRESVNNNKTLSWPAEKFVFSLFTPQDETWKQNGRV